MLIEFQTSDRLLGLKAIGVYRDGIKAASTACAKVFVDTMALQAAETSACAVETWAATNLEDMELGESRELEIPSSLALALRTACSCYLTQLGKLADKQVELLVPPDNTNDVISHLQSLADRLSGQIELDGTVTMQFGDAAPITIPSETLRRAARKARERAD